MEPEHPSGDIPILDEQLDCWDKIAITYNKTIEGLMGMLFVMESESTTTFKMNFLAMLIDFC
jgi:hypothetical protein